MLLSDNQELVDCFDLKVAVMYVKYQENSANHEHCAVEQIQSLIMDTGKSNQAYLFFNRDTGRTNHLLHNGLYHCR